MRIIPVLVFACLCLPAYAAQPGAAGKAEAPPPPPASSEDAIDAPEVKIIKQKDQTIEEYRIGGKLYMIKVTPKYGPPYYLVDDRGDGKFARQESLDSGFRVPRWIIKSF